MPRLSAIVPATDLPPSLERCTEAIRAAAEPPEELIVVTEASSRGPAAARNAGAARANGDVLVFVDADVVPHVDAFARLRAAFDADPGLSAVFGAYDDAPAATGTVSTFRNLLHHHVHTSAAGRASTFWAGLGAVRRRDFEAVGGFDAERYPHPSVEDIELGMRLAASGARIELEPAVQGKHLKDWSLTEMVHTDFARRGTPWVALLLEAGGPSDALNLGWRHRLSAAASLLGIGALAGRRPRLALGALAALVLLNRSFYALLLRRRGALDAAAGVGLHALHHLTASAAVPAGVIAHLLDSRRNGPPQSGASHNV